jgi:hypothetical protein
LSADLAGLLDCRIVEWLWCCIVGLEQIGSRLGVRDAFSDSVDAPCDRDEGTRGGRFQDCASVRHTG